MLQKIGITDEVELRRMARDLYRTKGLVVCLQCVYEMLLGAQIFMEVLQEEIKND